MSDEPKLLQCPFCCGEARFVNRLEAPYEYRKNDNAEVWDVECANKGCYLVGGADWWETKQTAAEMWNTRAEDAKTKAMREAIMRVLTDVGSDGDTLQESTIEIAMRSINAHFCKSYNFTHICPDDPEWEACTCKVKDDTK